MELTIKQIEVENKKEIIVGFAKEQLRISKDSEQWTNEGINSFLIKLAASTPNDEQITLKYDEENQDVNFQHILSLFFEFVEEYNKSIR